MEEQWFYIDRDGTQKGPVSKEELLDKKFIDKTYVWKDGMQNWQKFSEISELESALREFRLSKKTKSKDKLYKTDSENTQLSAPENDNNDFGESENQYVNNDIYKQDNYVNSYLKPDSHSILVILTLLVSLITCTFISLILAIIAIVYSNKVDKEIIKGNYNIAEKYSVRAKTNAIAALIIVALWIGVSIYGIIEIIFGETSWI